MALLLLAGCGEKPQLISSDKPFEYWLTAVKDGDAQVRKKAVFNLGLIGTKHEGAVPALIRAVTDPEPKVRGTAILALLKIGPDARAAIPALTAARNDEDEKNRMYAAKALERIQGKSP